MAVTAGWIALAAMLAFVAGWAAGACATWYGGRREDAERAERDRIAHQETMNAEVRRLRAAGWSEAAIDDRALHRVSEMLASDSYRADKARTYFGLTPQG